MRSQTLRHANVGHVPPLLLVARTVAVNMLRANHCCVAAHTGAASANSLLHARLALRATSCSHAFFPCVSRLRDHLPHVSLPFFRHLALLSRHPCHPARTDTHRHWNHRCGHRNAARIHWSGSNWGDVNGLGGDNGRRDLPLGEEAVEPVLHLGNLRAWEGGRCLRGRAWLAALALM